MPIDPAAIGGVVAGLGAIGWQVARTYNERKKTRDKGLADNPERCAQHEERLDQIERRLDRFEETNREDHGKIFDQIGGLRGDIARLSGRINGK